MQSPRRYRFRATRAGARAALLLLDLHHDKGAIKSKIAPGTVLRTTLGARRLDAARCFARRPDDRCSAVVAGDQRFRDARTYVPFGECTRGMMIAAVFLISSRPLRFGYVGVKLPASVLQYDESLHGGGYMEGPMYHEHRLTHPHLPPVHYPPPAAPAHALPGEPLVHKRDKDAIYGSVHDRQREGRDVKWKGKWVTGTFRKEQDNDGGGNRAPESSLTGRNVKAEAATSLPYSNTETNQFPKDVAYRFAQPEPVAILIDYYQRIASVYLCGEKFEHGLIHPSRRDSDDGASGGRAGCLSTGNYLIAAPPW
ncbi:hypothetical protein EVAR_32493_1 [Eumeta japonica]|uniref:Uncharacterized protein n=1 Tax=Eumeta variegata TaxID=151549 RepID=A0A4C1WA20_EUMVA|nr:hypothetical protein EVAR_32493_1 [Eumeta japonica]